MQNSLIHEQRGNVIPLYPQQEDQQPDSYLVSPLGDFKMIIDVIDGRFDDLEHKLDRKLAVPALTMRANDQVNPEAAVGAVVSVEAALRLAGVILVTLTAGIIFANSIADSYVVHPFLVGIFAIGGVTFLGMSRIRLG